MDPRGERREGQEVKSSVWHNMFLGIKLFVQNVFLNSLFRTMFPGMNMLPQFGCAGFPQNNLPGNQNQQQQQQQALAMQQGMMGMPGLGINGMNGLVGVGIPTPMGNNFFTPRGKGGGRRNNSDGSGERHG